MRADADPARQALFVNFMHARASVRLAYHLHERLRGTRASAVLVSGYGLAAFLGITPPRRRDARILIVARHANARREVARIASCVGASECDWLQGGAGASLFAALATLRPRRIRAAIRLVRTLDARHGFLVSCRAASALGWYARSRQVLAAHRPGAVLVSSDSNPEELGFVGAARALRIPQVFVSHAYPTPLSPPLDFTLSILEGEAAVAARRRKGAIKGAVLLAGVDGHSAPIDVRRFERPQPVVGIFTPKAVSWPTFAAIVDECRQHYGARQIVIRWHPSMLEPPKLVDVLQDRSGLVESPRHASLGDVARQCDWVVADENSNVHLPVLKLGIPTIAVRHLGLYPESRSDQYGFVAGGVVFPAVTSIRDVQPDALAAFFSARWADQFRRYDAAYLRPDAELAEEVRNAVRRLFEPRAVPDAPCPT